jgi:hypothetical protein
MDKSTSSVAIGKMPSMPIGNGGKPPRHSRTKSLVCVFLYRFDRYFVMQLHRVRLSFIHSSTPPPPLAFSVTRCCHHLPLVRQMIEPRHCRQPNGQAFSFRAHYHAETEI